jgi:hypothetical protein
VDSTLEAFGVRVFQVWIGFTRLMRSATVASLYKGRLLGDTQLVVSTIWLAVL